MPVPPADAPLPGPGAAPAPGEAWWQRFELAWPLAIVAGFGATWAGLALGFPGAAAILATALLAPSYVAQLARGRRVQAAVLALLWTLGIVGAVVGVTLEGSLEPVLDALPGARLLVASELGASAATSPLATLPRNLGVVALVLILARPGWGLLALLASALLAGALAGVAASWSVEAVEAGWSPSLAALAGLPPHLLLALVALFLGAAALAEPGLAPRFPFTELRRAMLWSAVGLAAVALGLQGWLVESWHGWLGR